MEVRLRKEIFFIRFEVVIADHAENEKLERPVRKPLFVAKTSRRLSLPKPSGRFIKTNGDVLPAGQSPRRLVETELIVPAYGSTPAGIVDKYKGSRLDT
jgi:hypothetical protein